MSTINAFSFRTYTFYLLRYIDMNFNTSRKNRLVSIVDIINRRNDNDQGQTRF